MKRLKRFFATVGAKNTVALLALALMIACTGYTIVNRFVNIVLEMLPPKEVTITVVEYEHPGTEVWILTETTRDMNLFNECLYGEKTGVWEYRDAAEWQYAANTLVSYGDNIGSSITFYSPVSPDAGVLFWAQPSCGAVSIATDGKDPVYYDLFSETSETVFVCPFGNSLLPVVLRLAVYFFGTLIIFSLLIMILYHLMTRGKKNRKKGLSIVFDKYYPVFLWLILYLYAAVQYKFGIPNYLEFGDQMYYWLGDLFAEGIWNPAYVATQTVGFRGWMCNLFPSISQHAGNLLRIDPVFIYLIFTSGAICWLCSYVMPKIYELLTNHKAGLLQKNAFILVYLFFWNGTLTAVLTDMFGAVAFLSGTMYALRFFFGKRQVTSAIGAGLFWAISCNFRTAYQYGIVVMIIAAIIVTGAKYIKRRKARREEEGNAVCYPKKGKKAVAGILCAIGMFVLTSFPQYAINVERGFSSFLPYDYAGAVGTLMVYADGRQATLLESSANQSLQYGYSGYPYVVSDDQMLSLKTQLYNSSDILSLSQILSVYSNNPLETLIYLVKKLLVAFDPKTNVTYPLYSLWRETPGLLFSFLNYFVIGSALYILVVGKRINIREKAVCAMFFIGLVLPQMFVHVEWRYFLSTYMLLYMLFTYHFVGAILTDPDEVVTLKKSNYLQYITVFILLAFTLSLTIFA